MNAPDFDTRTRVYQRQMETRHYAIVTEGLGYFPRNIMVRFIMGWLLLLKCSKALLENPTGWMKTNGWSTAIEGVFFFAFLCLSAADEKFIIFQIQPPQKRLGSRLMRITRQTDFAFQRCFRWTLWNMVYSRLSLFPLSESGSRITGLCPSALATPAKTNQKLACVIPTCSVFAPSHLSSVTSA